MMINFFKGLEMITTEFILAGRAVFTVSNDVGEHYTYKINKHKNAEVYFANVLCGGSSMYSYMGVLNKDTLTVHKGNKGMSPDAPSVKVLTWAMAVIRGDRRLPEGYNIQHMNKCGYCNRPLTTPESIETGLGPVCRDK